MRMRIPRIETQVGRQKKPLMRIHSNKNDGFQWIHQQQTEISSISKKTWDGFLPIRDAFDDPTWWWSLGKPLGMLANVFFVGFVYTSGEHMPNYGTWLKLFRSFEMVLAKTCDSRPSQDLRQKLRLKYESLGTSNIGMRYHIPKNRDLAW